ncbi:MAG: hypothetical protein H7Y18_12365 [Clostridiaceae bacterium]|nr:hypothetical protein [Clostridiaceae bacterium]
MGNKDFNIEKKIKVKIGKAQITEKRINELNKLIVDLEFDNRQLRMEVNFLYCKLQQKPPTKEDYETNF